MPRGRVETQTSVKNTTDKNFGNSKSFTPVPTHFGTIKILDGGGDSQLYKNRIIPFISGFRASIGNEYDFIKLSEIYPLALLIK